MNCRHQGLKTQPMPSEFAQRGDWLIVEGGRPMVHTHTGAVCMSSRPDDGVFLLDTRLVMVHNPIVYRFPLCLQ